MVNKRNAIKYKDRAEWLEARRKGIGGSDASAIMGQNQWSSPLSVYMDKRGMAPKKEPTEAMIQGTDCEEVVARRFERETGIKLRRCNVIIQHPDYPWMLASIDRDVVGHSAGFEAKTTSPYSKTDFADGEVPANYFWQCQHYMAVTGAQEWYLAVMVFSTGFYPFRIVRDENAIAQLIEAERIFWHDHVLAGVPPYPIGSDADDEAIDIMYATARYDKAANIDDMRNDLETLALYEKDAKLLKEKIDTIKQSVKMRMGMYTSALCGRWSITWKDQTKTTIDSKRLRAEQPQTFAMYSKTSTSRPLKIEEVKYGGI